MYISHCDICDDSTVLTLCNINTHTAQDQVRALEETKANLSGSWEFSAAQLEQAELEIEDCNHVIEELTAEIQDRYCVHCVICVCSRRGYYRIPHGIITVAVTS